MRRVSQRVVVDCNEISGAYLTHRGLLCASNSPNLYIGRENENKNVYRNFPRTRRRIGTMRLPHIRVSVHRETCNPKVESKERFARDRASAILAA